MKIVLISCVSKKLDTKAKAEDLYISTFFKLSLKYAKQQNADYMFILSAKYGLLNLDDVIEPYDLSLNNMKAKNRKIWAEEVLSSLGRICDLKTDNFIILAGNIYRQYLLPKLSSYELPLKGLNIGQQMQYLKRAIS